MQNVVLSDVADRLSLYHVRFLQEASRLGDVHVVLLPDSTLQAAQGRPPQLPQVERLYLLQSIRYVQKVTLASEATTLEALPDFDSLSPRPQRWIVDAAAASIEKQRFCDQHGLEYRVLPQNQMEGFPASHPEFNPPAREKVMATGCFDWFHSGHVRFFEEASALGSLYVVVGHDANILLLKGQGHPLFPQEARRYMVQSVRFVTEALISSGHGWMDAEPEIARIKPDLYVVNEDGDKEEKRQFCEAHGIRYVVLKRIPKKGLPRRSSTELRGF